MENINNKISGVGDNLKNAAGNINQNLENFSNKMNENVSNTMTKILPPGNLSSYTSDFLSSNTLIGKATFLLFVVLLFIFLFSFLSRVVIYFLSPVENPYILYGMKSANESLIINQAYAQKNSIPIFRSKNEKDGIEFTYSFWMFIESNLQNFQDTEYKHILHKGSITKMDDNASNRGIYAHNNCPGIYLYKGKDNVLDDALLDDAFPTLSMLVRVNTYQNNFDKEQPYKYFEDIRVENIPIKKWIHIVVRSTSQNILDVYINGKLVKRQRLSNVIKQNYDNLYVNMNGGFDGFMSNIKYYNYAIGTLEIDNVVKNGPNLKMSKNNALNVSKPEYLSGDWYFSETMYNQ